MVDRSPYAMLEQEGNHKEELEAMKRLMFEKEAKYKQEQAKKEEELKALERTFERTKERLLREK